MTVKDNWEDGDIVHASDFNTVADAVNVAEISSNKGQPNGYAPLNAEALIDSQYLPSATFDSIVPYENQAAFPGTGATSRLYIDESTNSAFIWTGSVYEAISSSTTALGITDSGATGRDIIRSGSQASARKALGPLVFDVRDYGVIADGSPYNNVANLLDCFAACAAAGGGTVLLPAGVIDTSEASLGTVTADSGNEYTNTGAIPIPEDCPIHIKGSGREATTVKLSPGFRRFADLWYTAPGHSWRDITISDLTVDRDDILGVDVMPSTAIGAGATLTGQSWTTVSLSASAVANAECVMVTDGPSAGYAYGVRVTGSTVELYNFESGSHTINSGNHFQGTTADHVLIGFRQYIPGTTGWTTVNLAYDVTVDGLTIRDVTTLNVPTITTPHTNGSPPDDRTANIQLQFSTTTTGTQVTNFTAERVRMYGGNTGIMLGGRNAAAATGGWIDNVRVDNCFHDTMVDLSETGLTTNGLGANFFFGNTARVGRVSVTNCHGRRSLDVALEFDNVFRAVEADNLWEDALGGEVLTRVMSIPAETSAGPVTATLGTDLSAVASGTKNTVTLTVPETVASRGWLRIGSETMWYQKASDTTADLWRGMIFSTSATHSNGDTAEFIEIEKTRIDSVRTTIRKTSDSVSVMSAYGAKPATYSSADISNYLPLQPLFIDGANVTISTGIYSGYAGGQFVNWNGWRPELSIVNSTFSHDNIVQTATGVAGGGAIGWSMNQARYAHGWSVPCPAPRIVVRNTILRASGKCSAGSNSNTYALVTGHGWAYVDVEILGGITIENADADSLYLARFMPSASPTTRQIFAPGSRLKLAALPTEATVKPIAAAIDSTTYVTVDSSLVIEVDPGHYQYLNSRVFAIDTSQVSVITLSGLPSVDNFLYGVTDYDPRLSDTRIPVDGSVTSAKLDSGLLVDIHAEIVAAIATNNLDGTVGLS